MLLPPCGPCQNCSSPRAAACPNRCAALASSAQDPHPFTMPSTLKAQVELYLQASFSSRLLLRYTTKSKYRHLVPWGPSPDW